MLSTQVFFNLKADIFFVNLHKLNILLEQNFDLHRTFIYFRSLYFYCFACFKNNLKYTFLKTHK